MVFFCVAGWFGFLFFLGKAAHCREKVNIIAYLIGLEEIFDPVMAGLSPLRKIVQILLPTEKSSLPILLSSISMNQQEKQCLVKGALSYLAFCDPIKDLLLK